MDFKNYHSVYKNELLENNIPFWERHCQDKEFGGFFTFLDRDGSVYDTDKYMWLQWRTVYMFAELYLSDFSQPRWLNIAKDGFEFLLRHGKSPDGSYYFALNRQGEPAVAPYNIYSDCFAVMGSAALYRAAKEEKYYDEAVSAMGSYLRRLDNPKGRWEKSLPGRKKMLSLGHYMMLANMGLIMKECLGTDKYDADVLSAAELVLDKFYHPEYKILFENITPSHEFDLSSCDGRHINPGHGLEALWFIMRIGQIYGREDILQKAASKIINALEFGWDKEFGGIYYFMDALGKPHVELQWDMKLWWVHCEAIIAALMAYKITGEEKFAEWFKRLHDWTWARYPDPQHGEWFAYLNRRGEPASLMKGGKWKTCFHLPRMLLICERLLR
jgi:N-acylglucosamine 2-epimerase